MHTLPELPYSYDALAPHIDEQTMKIHHDKHHATYVTNLNAALEGSELADMSIEELLQNLNKVASDKQAAVRNNGGGHFNHSLFWTLMSADGGGEPDGELKKALDATFQSFALFCEEFNKAGLGRFGSGWAWLVVKDGKLEIMSTPNQDSPIMDGIEAILGCDVWEHAYYLTYQNRRADYLSAWWNVVNWKKVAELYQAALQK